MTIARRLYLLVFAAVVGLLILSAIQIDQIQKVYGAANYANENTIPSLLALETMSAALDTQRLLVWKAIAIRDDVVQANLIEQQRAASLRVTAALDKYEKEYISDEKDRNFLNLERAAYSDYSALLAKTDALTLANKEDDARDLILANGPIIDKLTASFSAHRSYNVELGRTGAVEAQSTLTRANRLGVLVTAIVIFILALMGVLLVRRIVRSINYAVSVAQTIASGDLTSKIETSSTDEMGKLLASLSEMNGSLQRIVGKVRLGTDNIATASAEIASGNMDLSARTESQASALEETASSIEELTATVRQNAENTRTANDLANAASVVAQEGGEVVSRVVATMDSINTSSRKIVEIINVIDGIAFQTNILALNAAVEAARAGEQGRGFAVVATEVRNLAHRSATAAKEIKMLIDDSVSKVEVGGVLVSEAGETMVQVVASVRKVSGIINEIATASREQSSGIDQVNQAVMQMDCATQQNAALVEEAAAAAQALQEQATELANTVGTFKLDIGANLPPSRKDFQTAIISRALISTPSVPN